jgi:hypothetical protein
VAAAGLGPGAAGLRRLQVDILGTGFFQEKGGVTSTAVASPSGRWLREAFL